MTPRQCTTHSHACECREAEFARLKAENLRLQFAIQETANFASENAEAIRRNWVVDDPKRMENGFNWLLDVTTVLDEIPATQALQARIAALERVSEMAHVYRRHSSNCANSLDGARFVHCICGTHNLDEALEALDRLEKKEG